MTNRISDRKQAGRRTGSEWYECQRCGFPYPRASVIVQNGLIVCRGPNTTNCWDEKGHSAFMLDVDAPREKPIPPLPSVTEEV